MFTGILPICQDEDGLAAVLGHEIAHVVARHPAERMSGSFLALIGVAVISSLFDISGYIPSLIMNLLYSLPNSRTQEVSPDAGCACPRSVLATDYCYRLRPIILD